MAKITDIKFNFKGQDLKFPVNINSSGTFSANLPDEVSVSLSLHKELREQSLSELTKKFNDALERYKKSTKKLELFIFIKYQACGRYALNKDLDSVMFGQNNNPFYLSISLNDISALTMLKNIQEKIRSASEILFNLIKKDTAQIEQILNNQKLLM